MILIKTIKGGKKFAKFIVVFAVIFSWIFSGWPQILNFPPKIQRVYAATTTETITASQTWTAPPGVTTVSAECWGSGGQGGGSTSNTIGGTGGGAGAYAKTASVAVTPGTGYTLTVGALVTNGAGLAGGTGGDTSFTGDSSQKCLAKGGGGGGTNGGTAGAGGLASASTGDASTKFNGGGGWKNTSTSGGGGGSSGGTAAAGNTATTATGAAAVSGGGNGGNGGATVKPNDGSAPTTSPGGGGGGGGCKAKTTGCSSTGTNTTGGAGKIGQVKLTYTVYTILGNGASEPSNQTIAPDAAITDLDNFTFQSSITTDTVTALVVSLNPAGAYNNIAQVDIADTSNAAKCTAVTGLTSNTVTFSTCTVPVSTTLTTYKIRITPKTHANMPAPSSGQSYATTGVVASYTSTNVQTGTDSGSATVTIDNASPAGTTGASATAGDGQVSVGWTPPGDGDFQQVYIYCKTSSMISGEAPAEGTDPSVDATACDGTARMKYKGTASPQTISSLTNGTAYYFRIYARDNNGNFTDYASTQEVSATPVTAPTVTTQAAGSVEATTATGNGNITATGGVNATAWGVCYKTSSPCTTADSVAAGSGTGGTGAFTSSMTSLSTGTTYYIKAYATNSAGTSYGSEVQILTKPAAPTSLNFTSVTATTLRLNWTAPTGAVSYKVERCSGSGCTGFSEIASGVATIYYDDSILTCNTLYRYQVRATNATPADGAYSSIAQQTTGACNTAPSFSGNPADSPDPVVAGYNVTFSGTANDSESDNWYLAVCKTNSITAGTPPTCAASQTLCVSSSAIASGSSNSCTWTSSGSGAQSWYAFACDNNASPLCSSANTVNSPVTVNAVVVSASVSPTTTDYGGMAINEVKKASTANPNNEFIITNTGNVAEDFDIVSTDATGGTGWTLSTTGVGSSIFMHAYSSLKTLAASSTLGSLGQQATSWVATDKDPSYRALASNIAVGGTADLVLELLSPSAISDHVTKNITVTIRATQH